MFDLEQIPRSDRHARVRKACASMGARARAQGDPAFRGRYGLLREVTGECEPDSCSWAPADNCPLPHGPRDREDDFVSRCDSGLQRARCRR